MDQQADCGSTTDGAIVKASYVAGAVVGAIGIVGIGFGLYLKKHGLLHGRAWGLDPSQFDPAQLRAGIAVEMEHTRVAWIAMRIAMDHLVEDPNYYVKLATIHTES